MGILSKSQATKVKRAEADLRGSARVPPGGQAALASLRDGTYLCGCKLRLWYERKKFRRAAKAAVRFQRWVRLQVELLFL